MASTYPNDITIQGTQFVRFVPVTLTDATGKEIDSFGTAIDFIVVETEHPKFANVHEETTFVSKVLSGGDTLKHPESTNAFLAATGNSTSKTDNYDSIKVMVGLGYDDFVSLKEVITTNTKIASICIGYGRPADGGTMPAYLFIIGKMVGDLEWDSTQDINTVEFTVEGSVTYTAGGSAAYTDYNTAMSGNITLLDGSTVYPIPEIETADYTEILSGTLFAEPQGSGV